MATTPEGKVKEKVKKLLTKHGAYFFMPRGTTYGRSGIPDFIVCAHGLFVGVETKAGYNKPSALQDLEMLNIRKAGGVALVINEKNLGDLERLLDHLDTVSFVEGKLHASNQ